MKKDKIDKLNAIPILEVANFLSIDLNTSKKCNCFKGHDTKSPSLKFYENTNSYCCFGCGIGFSSINLVMDFYEIPFLEACNILDDKFFGNCSYKLPNIKRTVLKEIKTSFTPDIEVYQWIADNNTLTKKGINYLESRGFNHDTIKKYKIFDIEEPYTLVKKLKEIFSEEKLYKCGLLKIKDNKYQFAWWKYTIVFPYFNLDNNIIYLQGRYIDECKDVSNCLRWINLPNVKSSLYNMNILNILKDGDTIYICEGITDALTLNQKGKNAVAVMGANNFKKEYVYLLKNYDIWIVPDNDGGGEKFYKNVKEMFSNYLSIKRLPLDKNYNDITDYVNGVKNA